jgi:hypothetical protein
MGHKRQATYLQLVATIVAEAGEVLYGQLAVLQQLGSIISL